MTFKSPFNENNDNINNIKEAKEYALDSNRDPDQDPFRKYSPQKGFGPKTAVLNDSHTNAMNQNIDK